MAKKWNIPIPDFSFVFFRISFVYFSVKMLIEDEVGILCSFRFPIIILKYMGSLISLDIFWHLSKLGHPNAQPCTRFPAYRGSPHYLVQSYQIHNHKEIILVEVYLTTTNKQTKNISWTTFTPYILTHMYSFLN